MNEQHLNELADGIMALIEDEDPLENSIGVRGAALIQDFLLQTWCRAIVSCVERRRKRFVYGETRVRVCRFYFTEQIPQKRDRLMTMGSLGRSIFR